MSASPGAPGSLTNRDVPLHLARGVELLGEQPGSGYRSPPSLVRRADGLVVQLTPLLYQLLRSVDGERTPVEVAEVLSATSGRDVSEGNVWELVEKQLRPRGLLRLSDGSEPHLEKPNPLLGLRFRKVVSDPVATRRLTAPFAALFAPWLVLLVTVLFFVLSYWVLFVEGLGSATREAFTSPGLLLLVFVITVLSAGFHEFGHAAASSRGGSPPGVMGMGLYLVWPAFYTDVTDSYRLPRPDRLRVDLGGLYFNALVALAIFVVWFVSGFDALLLVVAAQILQMLRQLAPIVRFDGYHTLADLTGVPDLYARIGPTLKGLWPGNWGRPENRVLKPWARVVITSWVVLVVPLLLVTLLFLLVSFPRVAATAWLGLSEQWELLGVAFEENDPLWVPARILSLVALALPIVATGYLLVRLSFRALQGLWSLTKDRPASRSALIASLLALLVFLGALWWPSPERYTPIRTTESGTLLSALPGAPTAAAAPLANGVEGGAHSIWTSQEPPPVREEPVLALVLVPRDDPDATPAWVFPFDRPAPPGEGDNQALAINTVDGSTLYDVAFALVWADDGTVLNRNEAYAFASCEGCTTVAVAFQVVLVLGDAPLAVPQNLSGALNYDCLECVTYALAKQLVVTLPEGLSDEARSEVEALWEEISRYGGTLEGVDPEEIRERLEGFQEEILRIVEREGVASEDTSTATPSSSAPTTSGPAPASSSPAEPSGAPSRTASPSSSADRSGSERSASAAPSSTSASRTTAPRSTGRSTSSSSSSTPSSTPTP